MGKYASLELAQKKSGPEVPQGVGWDVFPPLPFITMGQQLLLELPRVSIRSLSDRAVLDKATLQ